MHVGLSRPSAPPYPMPDIDAAFIAICAEELGFESVFYGEHTITPLEEPTNNEVHTEGVPYNQEAIVALSRVSVATTRLRFGMGVCVIPQHNPVRLAKQLACLDYYSEGRLILGIGVGWSRHETEALGGRFDRRWGQAREAVSLMKQLWTQERVEHRGTFYSVPPVRCFPRPRQQSGPPVLMGSVSGDSLQRIVDYCDGWLPGFYTPEAIAAGPNLIRSGLVKIRELAAAAEREMREIPVTAMLRGDVDRDIVKQYEDAGAERIMVTLPQVKTASEARSAIEALADRLL